MMEMQTRFRCRGVAAVLAALASASALGQSESPAASAPPIDTLFFVSGSGPALPLGGAVDVVGGHGSVVGGVITGKPYAAESVTESTQVLADGNRIVHTNRSRIYRDSAGRTRREQSIEAVGPWSAGGDPVTMIVIDDPVAGASYVLDTRAQTAREVRQFRLERSAAADGGVRSDVVIATRAANGVPTGQGLEPVAVRRFDGGAVTGAASVRLERPLESQLGIRVLAEPALPLDVQSDDLGEQVLEGVIARGTRRTHTLPAGAIGNERPIETVTEEWYSEELGALLLRQTADPRFGETAYRLVGVTRSEPSPDLFQVPAGYELLASDQGFVPGAPAFGAERRMRLLRPEPPR